MFASEAQARCAYNSGPGYMVADGLCRNSQYDILNPRDVCERASNAKEGKPLVISDVYYYAPDSSRRGTALSLFFEEVTIQQGIKALPDSTVKCFRTRDEAEDYRRGKMAWGVRNDRQIVTVFIEKKPRIR
jgi:hypothetical protein